MTTTRRRLERIAALNLLERLLANGLEVEVDGGQLRIRPADRLTDDLREEATRLKPYVLRVLDPPRPTALCPNCGSPYLARTAFGPWQCWTCFDVNGEAVYELARVDPEAENGSG